MKTPDSKPTIFNDNTSIAQQQQQQHQPLVKQHQRRLQAWYPAMAVARRQGARLKLVRNDATNLKHSTTTTTTSLLRRQRCSLWLRRDNDNDKQHYKQRLATTTGALRGLILVGALIAFVGASLAAASYSNQQQATQSFFMFNSRDDKQASQQTTADDVSVRNLLTNLTDSKLDGTASVETVNLVWSKFADTVKQFAARKAQIAQPMIDSFLSAPEAAANISANCKEAINASLARIAQLDDWAVAMWNANGDLPATGMFEGTISSIGAFHQCVNVAPNDIIGRPQYCTMRFQPIMPKRPYFHNILSPIKELKNFTDTHKGDIMAKIASKAQYYYYIKLQMALCLPNKCSGDDVDLIGKQVAINTYLQWAGASCTEKRVQFVPDAYELVAILILGSLAMLALLGTIAHALNLRALFEVRMSRRRRRKLVLQQQRQRLLVGEDNAATVKDQSATTIVASAGATNAATANGNTGAVAANGLSSSTATSKPRNVRIHRRERKVLFDSPRALATVKFLLHFSVIRNARKLFDTSTSRNGQSLAASINNASMQKAQYDGKDKTDATINENNNNNNNSGKTFSEEEDEILSDNDTRAVVGPTNEIPLDSSGGDISCVHGLRFWTISWIIFGHTLQYLDWNSIGRSYEIEKNLTDFFIQPLLSASHSVDTFFLISGVLTTYVTWSITGGQYSRFNKFAFLISRYLRLTPQVMLVILIYFIVPHVDEGPFWDTFVKKESDNCKQNWWINALYLQAFYKSDKICNLVTWWLSIEMFYHFVSIFVIITLLKSTRAGITTAASLGAAFMGISFYIHYSNQLSPGLLPMHLQRYEVWTKLILEFFWTPFPHSAAYFVGMVVGYLLFNRKLKFTRSQVRLGWTFFAFSYTYALMGTYFWNNNYSYTAFSSSFYYNSASTLWALATGWLILACSLGHGSWINTFLSTPAIVPLGRATYMTYLAHMLVVMFYAGRTNLLIEPSKIVFTYIFLSNIVLSHMLGIALTLIYESPILHLQKFLVKKMAGKYNNISPPPHKKMQNSNNTTSSVAYKNQNNLLMNHFSNNNNNNVSYNEKDEVRIALFPTANNAAVHENQTTTTS